MSRKEEHTLFLKAHTKMPTPTIKEPKDTERHLAETLGTLRGSHQPTRMKRVSRVVAVGFKTTE